ncbi:hypothetical protein MMC07_009644 [Pseudocyphellaria aurata]|nr:hypothetical protein [Pseudocyphellaria aurata]
MATNYSIYAIPACFIVSLLPHEYAIYIIKAANNGRWDNANPRSPAWNEKIQKSVPAAIFGKYERAEAAHKNGMENLALFSTTIILGNVAALPASTLNTVAGLYLAMRVIYTLAYINTVSVKYSFVRTAVWASSTLLCFYQIIRAGNVFASRSRQST